MNAHIITETVNGVTNYISLNNEGQLVTASKNPMELPGFMTKEQAFKVITALRLVNKEEGTKYRVKAVSQALRDMITDIIFNQLPEAPMVAEEVSDKAIASWKPAVKQQEEPKAETAAEPEQIEAAEEPAKAEAKPAKKAKKQNK